MPESDTTSLSAPPLPDLLNRLVFRHRNDMGPTGATSFTLGIPRNSRIRGISRLEVSG